MSALHTGHGPYASQAEVEYLRQDLSIVSRRVDELLEVLSGSQGASTALLRKKTFRIGDSSQEDVTDDLTHEYAKTEEGRVGKYGEYLGE